MSCGTMITTGSEIFTWNSPVCTESVEEIINFVLRSDGTVVGVKSTETKEETVPRNACCIEGNMTSDDGLLMACNTRTSIESEMLSWDGAICTNSFNEVISYQVPSVGGPIARV